MINNFRDKGKKWIVYKKGVLIFTFWNKLGNFNYSMMYIHIICFGFTIFKKPILTLCFHFISFNFSVIQGGSLSSKVTSLFGIKFENMLIVLLKIFTCWWTFLQKKQKLPVNLVYCSSYSIYIRFFKIPNQVIIWRRVYNLKIKFAICYLMVTIFM